MLLGNFTSFKFLQSLKVLISSVIPSGIVIEVKLVHSIKAHSSILFTEGGILIEVKFSQLAKHAKPRVFIEGGSTIDFRDLQCENALPPI